MNKKREIGQIRRALSEKGGFARIIFPRSTDCCTQYCPFDVLSLVGYFLLLLSTHTYLTLLPSLPLVVLKKEEEACGPDRENDQECQKKENNVSFRHGSSNRPDNLNGGKRERQKKEEEE